MFKVCFGLVLTTFVQIHLFQVFVSSTESTKKPLERMVEVDSATEKSVRTFPSLFVYKTASS